MASSGGGKRSAAFSYGVLRGLRDFHVTIEGRDRRLLDELDTIAAVSGGSFPAAYYGVYRDKLFSDFEKDFLKQDIEAYIWGIYFMPWKWEWMLNPLYAINDEMGVIYDDLMFHGVTYADMMKQGKPFISISATDINYGTVFPFTQDQFDDSRRSRGQARHRGRDAGARLPGPGGVPPQPRGRLIAFRGGYSVESLCRSLRLRDARSAPQARDRRRPRRSAGSPRWCRNRPANSARCCSKAARRARARAR